MKELLHKAISYLPENKRVVDRLGVEYRTIVGLNNIQPGFGRYDFFEKLEDGKVQYVLKTDFRGVIFEDNQVVTVSIRGVHARMSRVRKGRLAEELLEGFLGSSRFSEAIAN